MCLNGRLRLTTHLGFCLWTAPLRPFICVMSVSHALVTPCYESTSTACCLLHCQSPALDTEQLVESAFGTRQPIPTRNDPYAFLFVSDRTIAVLTNKLRSTHHELHTTLSLFSCRAVQLWPWPMAPGPCGVPGCAPAVQPRPA